MANKIYIDNVTAIDAASMNDINNHVYNSAPVSPATTVHPASVIANTPAGNIASTTVQAALNELDTEKALLAGSASQTFSVATATAAPHAVPRGQLNASSGSSEIGFIQSGTGAVTRTVEKELRQFVTPQQFGAVANGSTDDSAAIVLAANYASVNNLPLVMTGNYGISKLTFSGYNGLSIFWNCTLTAISVSAQTCIFEIFNCTNIYSSGNININGGYKTNYECGVWLHSPTAAQFITLCNVNFGGCRIGYRFGDIAYPSALISEITINGGHTYGCPVSCELIGSQTVISVHGINWNSGYDGMNSAPWNTIPAVTVRAIGSYIACHGGEILMTGPTNGVVFEVQPVTDATYGNRYGTVVAIGSTVETASPLARAINPTLITPEAGSGEIKFSNCTGYHSQNLNAYIYSSSDFTGRINIKENKLFFGPGTRTQFNILCSGNAIIDCDQTSFYPGFLPWLAGISGGILRRGNGMTMYKNTSQPISNSVWTKISANGTISTGLRGGDQANSQFVAPIYGVYYVEFASYGSSSLAGGSDFMVAIYKNTVLIMASETQHSSALGESVGATVSAILTLTAGDVIEFYAQPSAGMFTVNNGAGNSRFIVKQID